MAVTLGQLLSGQVLSWPVDDDPEQTPVPNKKEGQLKKNGAKVGCWERTMTKLYLSCCRNSDGRTKNLSPGPVWCVRESDLSQSPPFLWGKAAAVDTHLGQDAVVGKRLGWGCFSLIKGHQPSAEACPHVQEQAEKEEAAAT